LLKKLFYNKNMLLVGYQVFNLRHFNESATKIFYGFTNIRIDFY
jgi:hypothetical protein